MSVSTTVIPEHVRSLSAAYGDLASLADQQLVAISSVKFGHLDPSSPNLMQRYEALRYQASLKATAAYAAVGVPQIVMVDGGSFYRVPRDFADSGAIVVQTPRPGLATPYLDAANLVRLHGGPKSSVLKAEADKFIPPQSLALITHMLEDGLDVLVGDRTASSMDTMTGIQHRTEALIDSLAPAILDVPHGASCGVQAYSPAGLNELLAYEDLLGMLGNNWKYLLSTPALAAQHGLRVAAVRVNIRYDDAMVAAEDNPVITLKRLEQLLLMLEGVMEIANWLHYSSGHMAPSAERVAQAATSLRHLGALVAQQSV